MNQLQDLQSIWEQYVASWKQPEQGRKRALWQECLDSKCVYTDPLVQIAGYTELLSYMTQFHEQSPGAYFETTEFMAHHRQSIAHWQLKSADGGAMGHGVSHGSYSAEGKLLTMTGFFDLPDGETPSNSG